MFSIVTQITSYGFIEKNYIFFVLYNCTLKILYHFLLI